MTENGPLSGIDLVELSIKKEEMTMEKEATNNIMELLERDGHAYLGIGENGVIISGYSLTDSMNGGMTLDVTTTSGGKARIKESIENRIELYQKGINGTPVSKFLRQRE